MLQPRFMIPGMWWGRRDALCRIAAAALWPGGDVADMGGECTVCGGPGRWRGSRDVGAP